MNRMSLVVVALVAAGAFAQEIGTEIQPSTPGNTTPTNRAFDPNAGPAVRPGKKAAQPIIEEPTSGASAGRGMFGVRVNVQAAQLTAPPAATVAGVTVSGGSPYSFVPSMGFSYFLDNELALLIDVGAGLGMRGSDLTWNAGLLIGIDYHFRKITEAIRPLINIQVGVAMPYNTTQTSDLNAFIPHLSVIGQFGGGAEYFFNPHFSVSGKVLIAFGYGYDMGPAVGHLSLNTSPAVSAAWYF